MATVNFYLKNPAGRNETLINLLFRFNGAKMKYSTGEKINPKFWNDNEQRVKKSFPGGAEFNHYLNKVEEEIQKIYRLAKSNGTDPTPEYLRDNLNKALNNHVKRNETFFNLFDHYIEKSRTFKKPNTIKKFITTLNYLRLFENEKRFRISFDTMDLKFYEMFTEYLFSEKNLTNNTVSRYIKAIKTFLRYATDMGVNQKQDFKKFRGFETETDIIHLTEEELNTLSMMDLSNNKRLERVRDVFLFGCYTGQRYSDIEKLKPENIKGDNWTLQVQKTKTNRVVPLSPLAKDILEKYGNCLPPVISNQKMNVYLKELCKLAEINEPTQITRHSGANTRQFTVPKYELIGSHTARRTFITLSLERGMRAETVMEITGHKNYRVFKRYINITDKIKHIEINKYWYKQPLLKVV